MLCECGCGQPPKHGNRFLRGHNGRLEYQLARPLKPAKSPRTQDTRYGEAYRKRLAEKQAECRRRQALKKCGARRIKQTYTDWGETLRDERGWPLNINRLSPVQAQWEFRLAAEGLPLNRGRRGLNYGGDEKFMEFLHTPEARRHNREHYLLKKTIR